jgi:hypothetical protein
MHQSSAGSHASRARATAGGVAALCATLSTGAVNAAPVVVNLPDIDLLTLTEPFALAIGGGAPQFQFLGAIDPDNPAEHIAAGAGMDGLGAFVGYLRNVVPPGASAKDVPIASALAGGETIDGARSFLDGGVLASFISGKNPESNGDFTGGIAYLGIQFIFDGAMHFGWIEVLGQGGDGVTLRCYGYETQAGTGIVTPTSRCSNDTPEPATLALLIAGAVGVATMRRRQRAA